MNFHHLSLTRKLTIAFSILVAILIGVSTLSVVSLSESQRDFDSFVSDEFSRGGLARDVHAVLQGGPWWRTWAAQWSAGLCAVVCTAMVHRCANRSGTAEVLAAHPLLAGAARAWGAQCRICGLKAVEACSPWIQTIRYIFGSCRRLYCGL